MISSVLPCRGPLKAISFLVSLAVIKFYRFPNYLLSAGQKLRIGSNYPLVSYFDAMQVSTLKQLRLVEQIDPLIPTFHDHPLISGGHFRKTSANNHYSKIYRKTNSMSVKTAPRSCDR